MKNKWVKITPTHSPTNLLNHEIIKTALDKISPPWASTNPSIIPPCSDNEFLTPPLVTPFNTALVKKNDKSSPGLDGIDYDIIKRLQIKYHLLLLDIYNKMFETKNYPISWKKSYIHFIIKPDNSGVRPIALTSCLCKLFETLTKQ